MKTHKENAGQVDNTTRDDGHAQSAGGNTISLSHEINGWR